jgi:hypothetical protein
LVVVILVTLLCFLKDSVMLQLEAHQNEMPKPMLPTALWHIWFTKES